MSRQDLDCKVYIGDLPRDATEKDVERSCSYYGHLKSVWVARNPAGFSFVEFEDPRDAEDAVNGLDGSLMMGSRIRVEHSTGKIRPKPWLRGGRSGGRGGGRDGRDRDRDSYRDRDRDSGGSRRPFNPDDKCYQCGERGHYAYDCSRYNRGGGGGGSRRSRSRSRSRGRKSYSRSRSRSRDRRGSGRDRGDKRRSSDRYSRERNTRSPVRSRTRSRSPQRDDD